MIDAFQKQRLAPTAEPGGKSVLIVDDDKKLMQCLARAMDARGFKVTTVGSAFDGLAQVKLSAPEYAVVDMRLEDGFGLDVISALKQQRPDARAIILTGYGNIATTVSSVKLGAHDYLTKPVDVDDVITALLAPRGGQAEAPEHPMSAAHVRSCRLRILTVTEHSRPRWTSSKPPAETCSSPCVSESAATFADAC